MVRAVFSLPRTVWLIGLISLLNDSASEMIYPLVPLYLASALMAGPRPLGLIEDIAEATASLLKLCSGVIVDRTRRAKPWVVVGYALAGFARPLIAFATGWQGLLVLRFADRLGKGLRTSRRDALLAASVDPCVRDLAAGSGLGAHRCLPVYHRAGRGLPGPSPDAARAAAGQSASKTTGLQFALGGTLARLHALSGRVGPVHLGQFVEHVPVAARPRAGSAGGTGAAGLGGGVAHRHAVFDAAVRPVGPGGAGAADRRRVAGLWAVLSRDGATATRGIARPVWPGVTCCDVERSGLDARVGYPQGWKDERIARRDSRKIGAVEGRVASLCGRGVGQGRRGDQPSTGSSGSTPAAAGSMCDKV